MVHLHKVWLAFLQEDTGGAELLLIILVGQPCAFFTAASTIE